MRKEIKLDYREYKQLVDELDELKASQKSFHIYYHGGQYISSFFRTHYTFETKEESLTEIKKYFDEEVNRLTQENKNQKESYDSKREELDSQIKRLREENTRIRDEFMDMSDKVVDLTTKLYSIPNWVKKLFSAV